MGEQMWVELLDGLALLLEPSAAESIDGRTPSRQVAVGRRWSWEVEASGVSLSLWETQWSTGEREIVLADQDLGVATPVVLTKLMSRRRALVERRPEFDYMSARRVDPDSEGWPKFSACTSVDIAQLVPASAAQALSSLGYIGTGSRLHFLDATGPNRLQLIAMFAPEARAAAVGFYSLTRVVPTLVRAGMLKG